VITCTLYYIGITPHTHFWTSERNTEANQIDAYISTISEEIENFARQYAQSYGKNDIEEVFTTA